MMKLNEMAFATAGAKLAALGMIVLSVLGKLGLYTSAVERMQDWHMFYSLSLGGIVAGIIEAVIWTFVSFYLFAWLYNYLAFKKKPREAKREEIEKSEGIGWKNIPNFFSPQFATKIGFGVILRANFL